MLVRAKEGPEPLSPISRKTSIIEREHVALGTKTRGKSQIYSQTEAADLLPQVFSKLSFSHVLPFGGQIGVMEIVEPREEPSIPLYTEAGNCEVHSWGTWECGGIASPGLDL